MPVLLINAVVYRTELVQDFISLLGSQSLSGAAGFVVDGKKGQAVTLTPSSCQVQAWLRWLFRDRRYLDAIEPLKPLQPSAIAGVSMCAIQERSLVSRGVNRPDSFSLGCANTFSRRLGIDSFNARGQNSRRTPSLVRRPRDSQWKFISTTELGSPSRHRLVVFVDVPLGCKKQFPHPSAQ